MKSSQIVVGIDGSSGALSAVRWAAAEAARRGEELLVVHVYDWRVVGARAPVSGAYADDARASAQALVDAAVADAVEASPEVRVRGEAVLGAVVPNLVRASEQATLLVLGSRGRGGFASLLLGSVSQQVATHAKGPVTVVRGRPGILTGSVVVGTDGSDAAAYAVGVAFEEARARGTGVVAVRAYRPPQPPWGLYLPPYVEDQSERRAYELERLMADVTPWAEKFPDVMVETIVVDRPAADALVGLSSTAELVVAGTRGHGGFTGLLLGSVGLQLLHHADCPVLLARVTEEA